MKILFVFSILAFSYVFSLWKWGGLDKTIMVKWEEQLHYERKALALAMKNRALEKKISDLQYQISELESKNKTFF